jgi:hypothetical protein
MTFILKCCACDDVVEYTMEHSGQSMYGAAYVAGAQHERANRSEGCACNAARTLRLIGVRVPGAKMDSVTQVDGDVTIRWDS